MKDLKSFLRSENHWRSPGTLEFISPRGSWSRKSVAAAADAYRRYNRHRQLGAQSLLPEKGRRSCAKDLSGSRRLSTFVTGPSPAPSPSPPPQRSIRSQRGPGACSPPLSRVWSPSPSCFLNENTWSKLDSRRGPTGWLDTVPLIFLFYLYRMVCLPSLYPLHFLFGILCFTYK